MDEIISEDFMQFEMYLRIAQIIATAALYMNYSKVIEQLKNRMQYDIHIKMRIFNWLFNGYTYEILVSVNTKEARLHRRLSKMYDARYINVEKEVWEVNKMTCNKHHEFDIH